MSNDPSVRGHNAIASLVAYYGPEVSRLLAKVEELEQVKDAMSTTIANLSKQVERGTEQLKRLISENSDLTAAYSELEELCKELNRNINDKAPRG
jgi:chromosome segregation ATPase